MVYVIEHDFCNPHIQEHLHLAFDNVPIIKVENTPIDDSSRKRSRKRKSIKKPEQVWLVKVNLFSSPEMRSAWPDGTDEHLWKQPELSISAAGQEDRSCADENRVIRNILPSVIEKCLWNRKHSLQRTLVAHTFLVPGTFFWDFS